MLKNRLIIGSENIRQRLQVSEATLMLLINQGRLLAKLTAEGRWQISETDLRKYLAGQKVAAEDSKKKFKGGVGAR